MYVIDLTSFLKFYCDYSDYTLVSLITLAITTRFNFNLISTAFGGGNVPALTVQRLEVAA